MHVAIRVANYQGNLETLLQERAPGFINLQTGRNDVLKYLKVVERDNETYVFMISTLDPSTSNPEYNLLMTVGGLDLSYVTTSMSQFVHQLGIATREAPSHVYERIHHTLHLLISRLKASEE